MKNYKVLAIVPARAGSKGLPGKNIKMLLDKPLLAWSIEHGLKSKYVDKTIVSTDSEEIAEISREYGAEVPFLRPEELARDDSPSSDLILQAISWFEEKGENFDLVVLLEPTSPLREVEDIDKSLEMLWGNPEAEAVVSVSKLEGTHPAFNAVLTEKGFIRRWIDKDSDYKVLRRQDLDDVYFFEGTVYVSYVKAFKEKKTFFHKKTLGYVVPRYKSLEIDEPYDLITAEAILRHKLKK